MKAVQRQLREGQVINGRYQIETLRDMQETGSVYLCRDLDAGKARVRMKVINADGSFLESNNGLSRELSFLRRLRHPNLIQTLDYGALEGSGELFLVEEWIDGEELYSGTEGMGIENSLHIILQLSKALHYLHTRGIVHGNLDRTNSILSGVGGTQELKLLGFGSMNRASQHGRKGGSRSLAYMAPEVLMNGAVNESSDAYSLGVMIYQLLIRRLPFEDADPGFLIQKHLQGTVDLRPIERLKCGSGLSAMICSLLDKDSSKRPSIDEVVMRIAGELPGGEFRNGGTSELESCLSASQLVGREEEMLRLQDCAMRVRTNSRGWTVFVAGDAGCGKTRCLEELKSWALLEGWRVTEGWCGTHEEGAYGPFRQILSKTEPMNGEAIFQFNDIPQVAELGAFEAPSEFAAGQFRDLLTRELVRRLADRPTLLLLHDFHLSDESTNTVLDYLSSDIQSHPILMCVSLRSGEEAKGTLGRVMDMVVRQERGQILSLSPLTKEDVGQLVAGMTGDRRLKQTLGSWMFESIGGNPYFLEEMLKHLVEQGLLRRELDQWRFMTQDLAKLEVPASVSVVLQRRLLQLSPIAKDLANWLALFNRPIPKALLSAVGARDAERISEPLEELKNRQMIRMEVQDPEEHVEFCHSLIAEVIRGDLPKNTRRRMHLRIAEVLEREHGAEGHLQELAMHYMESGYTAKAIETALMAAAECKREHCNEGALQFYEYIIQKRRFCMPNILDEIILETADSCCAIGIPKRGIEILSRSYRQYGRKPLKTRARLLFQMAQAYRHVGDTEKIEIYANKALLLLKKNHGVKERNLRAALLTHLAYCQLLKSKPGRGLQLLRNALATIPATVSPAAGQIYSVISALKRVSCDLLPAMKAAKESIRILGPFQNQHMLAVAHSHLGVCLVALGRFGAALEQHRKAVEISEQIRSLPLRAQALANIAECLCRQGHLTEAKSASENAVKLSIECGNPAIKHSSLAILAEIKISAGEYESASKILNDLDCDRSPFLAIFSQAHVSYLLARLHYELGQFDQALKHIEKLHELQNEEAPVYECEMAEAISARITFLRGGKTEAIQLLENMSRAVIEKRWPYQACLIMIHLGECLISAGNLLGARKAIRNAMRLAKGMNSDYLLGNAHLLMGRLLALWAPDDSILLLNAAKPEINAAVKLANCCGAVELLWRAYYELSKIEESLSDWESCLHYSSETMKLIGSLKTQVPAASIYGYCGAAFDRNQASLECERRRSLIQRKRKILDVDDIQDHQIRTLFRVSRIISSIRDPSLLIDAITDQLIQSIGVERVFVFMRDESTGQLKLFSARNIIQGISDAGQEIRRDILEDVSRHGRPFVSANAKGDPRVSSKGKYGAFESGAVLCAPLKVTNNIIGVLYADHSSPVDSLSESAISLFAAFCNLAAIAIDNALAHQQLLREKSELAQYLHRARDEYGEIVGKSAPIEQLRDRIGLAAASPLDILITGESGTGKELVAGAIYRTGRRKSGKLIPVDCGSLSDNLAEAELFGYRKGAFTGATENRQGLLEAAQGGVIFLDEISNLPLRLQPKLLRVLQEREVRRIGETTPRTIDLQVIAATNKDLFEEIQKGRFRSDLYYRLKMMEIRVPPLRDRSEDIPLLIECFLQKIVQSEGGRIKKLLPNARKTLQAYSYPGNVRELKNIIAESYYSAKGPLIDVHELPLEVNRARSHETSSESGAADRLYHEILEGTGTFEEIVREPFSNHQFGAPVVRRVIERALQETGGKYRDAFILLKIPKKRYSSSIQFLKRNKCYLDYRPFRRTRLGSQ
jgi:Nif-specific regulatory protein